MMVKEFYDRAELGFWHLMIPLLSESLLAQSLLNRSYRFLTRHDWLRRNCQDILLACLGLMAGLALGFLRAKLLH